MNFFFFLLKYVIVVIVLPSCMYEHCTDTRKIGISITPSTWVHRLAKNFFVLKEIIYETEVNVILKGVSLDLKWLKRYSVNEL